MNPLNYASLEACKRLIDAGIVLDTEKYWCAGKLIDSEERESPYPVSIPAPTMIEVWRELPETHEGCPLTLMKNYAGFLWGEEWSINRVSTNPTDGLIDLLILVRKEIKP